MSGKSNQAIRVAVIGCGRRGRLHAERLCADERVAVVALSDVEAGPVESLRQELQLDVPVFDDAKELLKQVALDAVVVASPTRYHYEHALLALQRGLHVLCEPPVTPLSLQVSRLVREAQQRQRVFVVANDRRWWPVYRQMREQVQSGRLGAVRAVTGHCSAPWQQAAAGTWRANPKANPGGYLTDVGTLQVDALIYVTGLPLTEVLAEVEYCGSQVEINARVTAQMGNAVPARLTFQGNSDREAENFFLHCERGVAVLHEGRLRITVDNKLQQVEAGRTAEDDDDNPTRSFVDVICCQGDNPAPAETALAPCRFVEAVLKSSETGELVKLETS